jgi:hypothetical protein
VEGPLRYMDIPAFEKAIEIADFEFFVRSRLNQAIILWSEQAFPLAGYMGWPNDPDARAASVRMLRDWPMGSKAVPEGLRQIQTDWTRVADIFNLHYDLAKGGHQAKRGGASVGEAIELAAAQSKVKGTSKANLWETWKAYKDVAHLVAAATIIADYALRTAKLKPFAESGLALNQIQPLQLTLLLPDFVLSLALLIQSYGLSNVPPAREQPMLNPETLWRIRPDMNVSPIARPLRKIGRRGIGVLNKRRAGNRGQRQASQSQTA